MDVVVKMEKEETGEYGNKAGPKKEGDTNEKNIASPEEVSPSKQIDSIIKKSNDWRGETLARLRTVILKADSSIIEEVKWKKPSKPEGVPVWTREGIVCVADTLKNAVRLTFPKGAQIDDTTKTFNTRLDSKTVRAIDYHKGGEIVDSTLSAIIKEAVNLNLAKSRDVEKSRG